MFTPYGKVRVWCRGGGGGGGGVIKVAPTPVRHFVFGHKHAIFVETVFKLSQEVVVKISWWFTVKMLPVFVSIAVGKAVFF